MTSNPTKKALQDLGFAFDERETQRSDAWPRYWRGFVVPLKPMQIDGDDFEGFAVSADQTGTRGELDELAIEYAKDLSAI